jgi:uncharacterized membrane protein
MPQSRAAVERLGSFSDSVFAFIIIIMVLELKPPEHPTFAALLPLWPTALSYAVSYQFIAIVWINHHRLLRFANEPTAWLIWVNFALLFMVSLVPFSTAWVARTHLAAVPVFIYAAVFVLVELAYLQFDRHTSAQTAAEKISHQTRRFPGLRSLVAFGPYLAAMLVSLKFPWWGFATVCCLFLYLRPDLAKPRREGLVTAAGKNDRPAKQESDFSGTSNSP